MWVRVACGDHRRYWGSKKQAPSLYSYGSSPWRRSDPEHTPRPGGWGWLTFDDLLHQRTVGPLVGAVHDAVGYPSQVAHVAMPPAPLSPVREGGQSAREEESLHKSQDGHKRQNRREGAENRAGI